MEFHSFLNNSQKVLLLSSHLSLSLPKLSLPAPCISSKSGYCCLRLLACFFLAPMMMHSDLETKLGSHEIPQKKGSQALSHTYYYVNFLFKYTCKLLSYYCFLTTSKI